MKRIEIISRLRGFLKEQFGDSRVSNRYLWSLFVTKSWFIIERQLKNNTFYNQSYFWQNYGIDLEPVSPIVCQSLNIPTAKTIYRSKTKIPRIVETSSGILYNFLATIDLSQHFHITTPYAFNLKTKIKYNKEKYAFVHDGYLYTNESYPKLILNATFENLGDFCKNETNVCNSALEEEVNISKELMEAVIQLCQQDLIPTKQIQVDEAPNNNSQQIQGTP